MRSVSEQNRRRRDHESKRGGERQPSALVATHDLALEPGAAMSAVASAVKEATGIALEADGEGDREVSFFRVLTVGARVTPGADPATSRVEIRVEERGQRTAVALLLMFVAFATIVPFVVLAIVWRSRPRRADRQRAAAQAIARAIRGRP